LFVYGTLRPKAAQAFAEARDVLAQIEPYWRHVGEARARGRLHWIGSYPALVDSTRVRDNVTGDVLAISRPDAVFPLLDAYENASTVKSSRYDYIRSRRRVTLANGAIMSAWVYVHNKPAPVGARIVSGDFIQACVQEDDVVLPRGMG
jgi:gamma-glutamylcyclotransferase (GGCT)/AIG2-like uncharacterized protein YtfP